MALKLLQTEPVSYEIHLCCKLDTLLNGGLTLFVFVDIKQAYFTLAFYSYIARQGVDTMYNKYFGLSEPPFSIAPDPRFLFMSEQHREALAHLLYGISSNGGFILLTGEVGTGKTTVSRCLLEQLPEDTEVAFILNSKYSVDELLAAICDDLGITYPKDDCGLKAYVDAINQHLLKKYQENKHTVLIIDEAQNLSVDVLETIRLLTNLETNTQKLLQIILIGQPELTEKLKQPELRQINQRITARYHLRALSPEELPAYIRHRLSVAGVDGLIFQEASLKRLYKLTRGVPRLVNIICDRAMLGAYVQRENMVRAEIVGKAADEVMGEEVPKSADSSGVTISGKRMSLAAFVIVCLCLVWVIMTFPENESVATLRNSIYEARTWVAELVEVTPLISVTANDDSQPPKVEQSEISVINSEVSGPNVATAKLSTTEVEVPEPLKTLSNPASWKWADERQAGFSEVLAYQKMFDSWNIVYEPKEGPEVCRFAETQGLRCFFQVRGLDELIRLNRPAVIQLFNASGQNYFVTMTAVEGDVAELWLAGKQRYVSLDDLALWLTGNFTLFWRKPDQYQAPVIPWAESQAVAWVDQQLAVIQGRLPRESTRHIYDSALVRQVKRFQVTKGLNPDGVVGPQTAIEFASITSADTPLLIRQ